MQKICKNSGRMYAPRENATGATMTVAQEIKRCNNGVDPTSSSLDLARFSPYANFVEKQHAHGTISSKFDAKTKEQIHNPIGGFCVAQFRAQRDASRDKRLGTPLWRKIYDHDLSARLSVRGDRESQSWRIVLTEYAAHERSSYYRDPVRSLRFVNRRPTGVESRYSTEQFVHRVSLLFDPRKRPALPLRSPVYRRQSIHRFLRTLVHTRYTTFQVH